MPWSPVETILELDSMQARSPLFRIILALLVLAAPSAWAQDGLQGAVSKMAHASSLSGNWLSQGLAAADFDNDQKPDAALLFNAGEVDGQTLFRIELHVTAGANRSLTFISNDRSLTISARDMNRDGVPDLVVEQAFTHKRLQVWINDGHGNFREARSEDFGPSGDSPWSLRAPFSMQGGFVPSLPTKVQSDSALQLLQILRLESSSSRWRVRQNSARSKQADLTVYSPRPPPASLLV